MLVMLTFMTSEYSVWLSSKMSISMNKVSYLSLDVKYCFDQRFRWIERKTDSNISLWINILRYSFIQENKSI